MTESLSIEIVCRDRRLLDSIQSQCQWAAANRDEIALHELARLPKKMLLGYDQQREHSPLGQVFSIANGLHEQLDSVVVLGSKSACSGPKALMSACCDPYHNEQTRATRGSKPRMYFCGSAYDNDAVASLMDRLRSIFTTREESRWGIALLSSPTESSYCKDIERLMINQLMTTGENADLTDKARFITSVVRGSGRTGGERISEHMNVIDPVNDRSGAQSLFSPTGVFPAALLGLDCIALLDGAMQTTNRFTSEPVDTNQVVQLAAMIAERHRQHGNTFMGVHVFSESLIGVANWYREIQKQAFSHNHTVALQQHPSSVTSIPGIFVAVDSSRTDPLNNAAGVTFDELQQDIYESTIATQAASGPVAKIVLKEINTRTLGQLCQTLILATLLEQRGIRHAKVVKEETKSGALYLAWTWQLVDSGGRRSRTPRSFLDGQSCRNRSG